MSTTGRLHALTPVTDAHDVPIRDEDGETSMHQPILQLGHETQVPRCDECSLPAGVPHAEYCAPEIAMRNGAPRYPNCLVYWSCRDLACCPTARCEHSHLERHRVARDREARRAA